MGEGQSSTRVTKTHTVEMWGLGRFCLPRLPSPTQGMLAVAAGMQALSSASAFCSALGLCEIMTVGMAGTSKSFLSLGSAPARAPQNLHAIRTDSGLILEWEEVIPEDPGEGPLGPYKLSWVQENGTQVRELVPSATSTVLESLPCTSET